MVSDPAEYCRWCHVVCQVCTYGTRPNAAMDEGSDRIPSDMDSAIMTVVGQHCSGKLNMKTILRILRTYSTLPVFKLVRSSTFYACLLRWKAGWDSCHVPPRQCPVLNICIFLVCKRIFFASESNWQLVLNFHNTALDTWILRDGRHNRLVFLNKRFCLCHSDRLESL